jgi:hypothetical protein
VSTPVKSWQEFVGTVVVTNIRQKGDKRMANEFLLPQGEGIWTEIEWGPQDDMTARRVRFEGMPVLLQENNEVMMTKFYPFFRPRPWKKLASILLVLVVSVGGLGGLANAQELSTSCEAQCAVTAVHCAALGLGGACNVRNNTEMCNSAIRAYIDPIRFYPDESGYFYVYNFDCVNIAHATQKDLEGKDLSDYQDCKGKYVIRELAAQAKKGGGFVEYHWIKPGSKGEKLKLGYVEPIPGTDYFIGTGVYEGSLKSQATPASDPQKEGERQ